MRYYSKRIPYPDVTECFSNQGGLELMTDVFLPNQNRRKGSGVIFIHGGGWNDGKRQDFSWHTHRLSLHGYVACTIDYRLSDTATFPGAVEDCQSAVKWLRVNADRFNIHSDRIGAMGSSAGGTWLPALACFAIRMMQPPPGLIVLWIFTEFMTLSRS